MGTRSIRSFRRWRLKKIFASCPAPYIRNVTIFCSDIAKFASIAEQTPPARLLAFLGAYMKCVSDIIISNGGHISRYEGDSIYAFWDDGNYDGPVLASIDCRRHLHSPEIQNVFKARLQNDIDIVTRFGLHYGEVAIGDIGTDGYTETMLIGNTVNIASRLESANKNFNTRIIISENLRNKLPSDFAINFRDLGQIFVANIYTPIHIYEPIINDNQNKVVDMYLEALHLYKNKNIQEALHKFAANVDDGPSACYAKKCRELLCSDNYNDFGIRELSLVLQKS